jgi:hypothetical protein
VLGCAAAAGDAAHYLEEVPAEPDDPADPIADVSGYELTELDLAFLRIGPAAVALWRERVSPLGMDDEHWDYFTRELRGALDLDGIGQVDIRLQGSSASFFSGAHKLLPQSDGIFDAFRLSRGRPPERIESDRIKRLLAATWPDAGPRPVQRPFDSMYWLGVDGHPSDYDIQISSDTIDQRARDLVAAAGVDPLPHRIASESYGFVRKDLVERVCPHLHLWSLRMTEVLNRTVAVAVFGSDGPPEVEGPVSSHHRETDWMVPG